MKALKTITLIGSGNVATQLGLALYELGFVIEMVYSNSNDNAKTLSDKLNANPTNNIKDIIPTSDIYIIALKDDAILKLVNQLNFKDKLIVHTSGSIGSEVFDGFKNYGIFYPLQTFSKGKKVDFSNVPICIEANSTSTYETLLELAKLLSTKVYEINSEQRKKIHLAAVFACNFSNHMYTIAEELLSQSGVDFDILKPLIIETAKKIEQQSPKEMQTGPAKRNDQEIIKNQLEMLAQSKDYQDIYKIITENIIKHS